MCSDAFIEEAQMGVGRDGLTEAAVCRNFEVSQEFTLYFFELRYIVFADTDEGLEDGVDLFLHQGLISGVSSGAAVASWQRDFWQL